MDVKASDLATIDEKLSEWSHAKSVVFDLYKLLFDTIGSSDGEYAELGFLGIDWSKLVDEVHACGVLHLVAFQHFSNHGYV